MARVEFFPVPRLHALPQVPQQRDLNWLSWHSLSCFTFSQYLVVSLHSTGKEGWGRGRGQKGNMKQRLWAPGLPWAPDSCAGGATAVLLLWAGLASAGLSHLPQAANKLQLPLNGNGECWGPALRLLCYLSDSSLPS